MAVEIVQWAGKPYRLDYENPDVGQMMNMRTFTGLTYLKMLEAVDDAHDQALQALLWLMLMQAGEPCNIEEVPWPAGQGPLKFWEAFRNRETPVVEAPKPVAGSTPSSPPTSEPSALTTSTVLPPSAISPPPTSTS